MALNLQQMHKRAHKLLHNDEGHRFLDELMQYLTRVNLLPQNSKEVKGGYFENVAAYLGYHEGKRAMVRELKLMCESYEQRIEQENSKAKVTDAKVKK